MGFKGEHICIMGKIRAVLLCYPSLTPLSCQWPSRPLFNSQHALGLEVHAWVLTNRHSQRSFSLCLRYLILRHVCVTSSTPKTPCWDQQKNKHTNSCLQLNLVYFSTLCVYACKCALILLCTFFFFFCWCGCDVQEYRAKASMWLKNKLFCTLISFYTNMWVVGFAKNKN